MIPSVHDLEKIKTWQYELRGQNTPWLGEDNEEKFQKNLQDQTKYKILRASGWLDNSIEYKFNSEGFRGHEFNAQDDYFCVFGDSVTFGTALQIQQTYGGIIESRLGMKCYNFGQAGGSDSTSVRHAWTYLPTLKPKFVVFQTTFDHRLEWIESGNNAVIYGIQAKGGGQPPTTSGDLYRSWIDVDINRSLLKAKNLMCFRYICRDLDVKLIEIDIADFFGNAQDTARDLLHPGPKSHLAQAERIMQQL